MVAFNKQDPLALWGINTQGLAFRKRIGRTRRRTRHWVRRARTWASSL